jgi:hypothetical protein
MSKDVRHATDGPINLMVGEAGVGCLEIPNLRLVPSLPTEHRATQRAGGIAPVQQGLSEAIDEGACASWRLVNALGDGSHHAKRRTV